MSILTVTGLAWSHLRYSSKHAKGMSAPDLIRLLISSVAPDPQFVCGSKLNRLRGGGVMTLLWERRRSCSSCVLASRRRGCLIRRVLSAAKDPLPKSALFNGRLLVEHPALMNAPHNCLLVLFGGLAL